MNQVINIKDKFEVIDEVWTPKIVAQMNDYHVKLAKFEGTFTWHDHQDTDEIFYVIKGEMTIEFRDKVVKLQAGEMFVVPKGVEHKPSAIETCQVMLIEPAGTVNTGDSGGHHTASNNTWI